MKALTRFAVSVISIGIFTACDSSQTEVTDDALTLSVPQIEQLRTTRSDHDGVRMLVYVDSNLQHDVANDTYELARIELSVPNDGFNLRIEWIDRAVNDVILADYTSTVSPPYSDLSLDEFIYNIEHDYDGDGVTNLKEIYRNTNLRLQDTLPQLIDIPPSRSTNNCFDIGTNNPVVENDATPEREAALEDVCLCYSFQMSENEVTFAQYAAFADEEGLDLPIDQGTSPWDWEKYNHPVVNVAYVDAEAYANWVGEKLELDASDSATKIRPPTEAEWEFAARAGMGLSAEFYSGVSPPGFENINSASGTRPVQRATSNSNPWGLYDIHGNVMEWSCSASTNNDGYRVNNDAFVCASAGRRTVRGGSYSRDEIEARFSSRLLNVRVGIPAVEGFNSNAPV